MACCPFNSRSAFRPVNRTKVPGGNPVGAGKLRPRLGSSANSDIEGGNGDAGGSIGDNGGIGDAAVNGESDNCGEAGG